MKLSLSMLQIAMIVVVKLRSAIAGIVVLQKKSEIAVMQGLVGDDWEALVDGEHNLPVPQDRDLGRTGFCQCPHTHFRNEDLK